MLSMVSRGHVRGQTPGVAVRATSAGAVGTREAGCEEAHQECGGEADDVQIVAFDAFDQTGAQTLDGVGARAALPFARRDVPGHVARGELPERDPSLLVLDDLPGGSNEAETREDSLGAAA